MNLGEIVYDFVLNTSRFQQQANDIQSKMIGVSDSLSRSLNRVKRTAETSVDAYETAQSRTIAYINRTTKLEEDYTKKLKTEKDKQTKILRDAEDARVAVENKSIEHKRTIAAREEQLQRDTDQRLRDMQKNDLAIREKEEKIALEGITATQKAEYKRQVEELEAKNNRLLQAQKDYDNKTLRLMVENDQAIAKFNASMLARSKHQAEVLKQNEKVRTRNTATAENLEYMSRPGVSAPPTQVAQWKAQAAALRGANDLMLETERKFVAQTLKLETDFRNKQEAFQQMMDQREIQAKNFHEEKLISIEKNSNKIRENQSLISNGKLTAAQKERYAIEIADLHAKNEKLTRLETEFHAETKRLNDIQIAEEIKTQAKFRELGEKYQQTLAESNRIEKERDAERVARKRGINVLLERERRKKEENAEKEDAIEKQRTINEKIEAAKRQEIRDQEFYKLQSHLFRTRALGQAFSQIGRGLLLAMAPLAFATGAMAKSGLEMGSDIKIAQLGFEALTGSAETAAAFIRAVRKEAIGSILTFKELLPISTRLASTFGKDNLGRVQPLIRAIGDLSVGKGAYSTDRQNRIYNSITSMLNSNTMDQKFVKQFNRAMNFNLQFAMKQMYPGTKSLGDMVAKGIGADRFFSDFVKWIEKSKYGGMQEKILRTTLPGLFSGIKDAWTDLTTTLLQDSESKALPALNKLLDFLVNLGKNRTQLDAISKAFGMLASIINTVMSGTMKLVEGFAKLNPGTQEWIVKGTVLLTGLTALSAIVSILFGGMIQLATNIGLAITWFIKFTGTAKTAEVATAAMGTTAETTAVSMGVLGSSLSLLPAILLGVGTAIAAFSLTKIISELTGFDDVIKGWARRHRLVYDLSGKGPPLSWETSQTDQEANDIFREVHGGRAWANEPGKRRYSMGGEIPGALPPAAYPPGGFSDVRDKINARAQRMFGKNFNELTKSQMDLVNADASKEANMVYRLQNKAANFPTKSTFDDPSGGAGAGSKTNLGGSMPDWMVKFNAMVGKDIGKECGEAITKYFGIQGIKGSASSLAQRAYDDKRYQASPIGFDRQGSPIYPNGTIIFIPGKQGYSNIGHDKTEHFGVSYFNPETQLAGLLESTSAGGKGYKVRNDRTWAKAIGKRDFMAFNIDLTTEQSKSQREYEQAQAKMIRNLRDTRRDQFVAALRAANSLPDSPAKFNRILALERERAETEFKQDRNDKPDETWASHKEVELQKLEAAQNKHSESYKRYYEKIAAIDKKAMEDALKSKLEFLRLDNMQLDIRERLGKLRGGFAGAEEVRQTQRAQAYNQWKENNYAIPMKASEVERKRARKINDLIRDAAFEEANQVFNAEVERLMEEFAKTRENFGKKIGSSLERRYDLSVKGITSNPSLSDSEQNRQVAQGASFTALVARFAGAVETAEKMEAIAKESNDRADDLEMKRTYNDLTKRAENAAKFLRKNDADQSVATQSLINYYSGIIANGTVTGQYLEDAKDKLNQLKEILPEESETFRASQQDYLSSRNSGNLETSAKGRLAEMRRLGIRGISRRNAQAQLEAIRLARQLEERRKDDKHWKVAPDMDWEEGIRSQIDKLSKPVSVWDDFRNSAKLQFQNIVSDFTNAVGEMAAKGGSLKDWWKNLWSQMVSWFTSYVVTKIIQGIGSMFEAKQAAETGGSQGGGGYGGFVGTVLKAAGGLSSVFGGTGGGGGNAPTGNSDPEAMSMGGIGVGSLAKTVGKSGIAQRIFGSGFTGILKFLGKAAPWITLAFAAINPIKKLVKGIGNFFKGLFGGGGSHTKSYGESVASLQSKRHSEMNLPSASSLSRSVFQNHGLGGSLTDPVGKFIANAARQSSVSLAYPTGGIPNTGAIAASLGAGGGDTFSPTFNFNNPMFLDDKHIDHVTKKVETRLTEKASNRLRRGSFGGRMLG